MTNIKLKSGTLITIEYERDKDDFIEFSTLVESVYDDSHFLIMSPMYHGRTYLFKERDSFSVTYTHITEDDHFETYQFSAVPTERVKINNFAYLKIKRTSAVKKRQRRDFFRLEYVKELLLKVELEPKVYEDVAILSKDISAGGMRAISPQKIKDNTKIMLYLDIGDEVLEMKGNVISSEKIVDSLKNYDIRMKFDHNRKADISKLTRYVLEVQASHIRKMAQADGKERMNLSYASSTYRERRLRRDWVVQWLDLSVVVNWFLLLIITINFILAKPPWKFGIQKFWGADVRTAWDIDLLYRNMLLFVAMLTLSGVSLLMNSLRMKRASDQYRRTLIIAGVISFIALIIYALGFNAILEQTQL